MSGILRLGGNMSMLEKSVSGISGCTSFATNRANCSKGNTCASAMLNVLKDFSVDKKITTHKPVKALVVKDNTGNNCPECHEPLVNSGGCVSCVHCGYSKCN